MYQKRLRPVNETFDSISSRWVWPWLGWLLLVVCGLTLVVASALRRGFHQLRGYDWRGLGQRLRNIHVWSALRRRYDALRTYDWRLGSHRFLSGMRSLAASAPARASSAWNRYNTWCLACDVWFGNLWKAIVSRGGVPTNRAMFIWAALFNTRGSAFLWKAAPWWKNDAEEDHCAFHSLNNDPVKWLGYLKKIVLPQDRLNMALKRLNIWLGRLEQPQSA